MSSDEGGAVDGSENAPSLPPNQIRCPYGPHPVPVDAFSVHVLTCRRQYVSLVGQAHVLFARCGHNGTHYVPYIEKHFHERMCKTQRREFLERVTEHPPIPIPIIEPREQNEQQVEEDNGQLIDI